MTSGSRETFQLRAARQTDLPAIRALIRLGRVNPLGLKWSRFVVAVAPGGQVIGCGQVKPHQDGSRELSSLVVHPAWRRRGVAGAIIGELLKRHPGELYLMCRAVLGPFYERFGFQRVDQAHMPRYFRRIKRLSRIYEALVRDEKRLLVMRRP